MAQSGLILVPLLLLSIVTIGQCKSTTPCTSKTEVKYIATTGRPLGASWDLTTVQVTTGYPSSRRKEECRYRCERKCKSQSTWTGCVAFASELASGYSSDCYCWGYKSLPSFGSEVTTARAKFLSGWCATGWFENEMTF